jgi:hypothetical protein
LEFGRIRPDRFNSGFAAPQSGQAGPGYPLKSFARHL